MVATSLDDERLKFVTTVGLITSDGPYGPNIMSAEWTHNISYAPFLVAVSIRPTDATYANIKKTGEFGANICADDQATISAIAGSYSKRDLDKIAVLKELGYKFFKAKTINVLMIEGAAMNMECKVVKAIPLGDHTTFVGEVQNFSAADKMPIVYHDRKYWKLTENVPKPSDEMREEIKKLAEKYRTK